MTGVGPKVALAITGSRPVADLQLAIIEGDQAMLTAIPGIGKRLAERVIFELKEKVAAAGDRRIGRRPSGAQARTRSSAALQALGYSLGEARDASRAAAIDPAARRADARGPGQGRPADAPARLTPRLISARRAVEAVPPARCFRPAQPPRIASGWRWCGSRSGVPLRAAVWARVSLSSSESIRSRTSIIASRSEQVASSGHEHGS